MNRPQPPADSLPNDKSKTQLVKIQAAQQRVRERYSEEAQRYLQEAQLIIGDSLPSNKQA